MKTATATRPLGAQISHMLHARGVDVIFGIPGVHNVEMYRGIEEAGITHVLARHEQGAGFMADGYARATGKPGVAYVITGPGVCNIMTPMGQAYSDSVSMLVLSSCLDEVAARKGQLHQMKDQRAAAETVCDWSETATSAEAAYELVDKALAEFKMKRPRSKAITLPIELLGAEAAEAPAPLSAMSVARAGADEVSRVLAALKGAKCPLVILGGGAVGAASLTDDFLRETGAASFTTYAGRGLVSADNPLYFGASMARSEEVMARADVILAIGTELAEVDLWRTHLGHKGRLIRVDIDAEVFRDSHRADDVVLSDAKMFLAEAMAQGVTPATTGWDAGEVRETRARWRAEVDAERPGIVPIADALKAALPDETLIYSDMTQFAYTANEVWDMPQPGCWHHPSGFGTLGYALPAAIGAKIGVGDRPVVAVMGDYGFHYTMQELGVAVELGLSLPIILWDNGKLKEIEDCMVQSQIAPNAVIAQNPDFCKLAEAFGAGATMPKDLSELGAAVKAALLADGPTLIYVTPDITL